MTESTPAERLRNFLADPGMILMPDNGLDDGVISAVEYILAENERLTAERDKYRDRWHETDGGGGK